MRKHILIIAVLTASLAITACNDTKNEDPQSGKTSEQSGQAGTYQCPMKCEGDKTYNQEGNCPICNMKLEKTDRETKEGHHEHEHNPIEDKHRLMKITFRVEICHGQNP